MLGISLCLVARLSAGHLIAHWLICMASSLPAFGLVCRSGSGRGKTQHICGGIRCSWPHPGTPRGATLDSGDGLYGRCSEHDDTILVQCQRERLAAD
eukprot:7619479-Pyramimonas_sp.AAC.2